MLRAEKPREGRVLSDGELGKSEAAAGHEMRLAARSALPADHATPDHLGGEGQRPERRREFEWAGGPWPEEVEVLDPRAIAAEVEEVHLPAVAHSHGQVPGQRRAPHRTPFLYVSHGLLITGTEIVYHRDAHLRTRFFGFARRYGRQRAPDPAMPLRVSATL